MVRLQIDNSYELRRSGRGVVAGQCGILTQTTVPHRDGSSRGGPLQRSVPDVSETL